MGEMKCVECRYFFIMNYKDEHDHARVKCECRFNPPTDRGFPYVDPSAWCGRHDTGETRGAEQGEVSEKENP